MARKEEPAGTWIPSHILEDSDLSASNKILYAMIASFKTCFASNKYLATRLNLSINAVQKGLQVLEEKQYIVRPESDQGRIILAIRDEGGRKLSMGGVENSLPNSKVDKKGPTDSRAEPSVPLDGPEVPADENNTSGEPTAHALHYRVIKKYGLPVNNHRHVPAKSKAMVEEIGEAAAKEYFNRLLEVDYTTLSGEFKPSINHSLDLYNKRIAISKFLDDNGVKNTKKSWTPPTEAEAQAAEIKRRKSNAQFMNNERAANYLAEVMLPEDVEKWLAERGDN